MPVAGHGLGFESQRSGASIQKTPRLAVAGLLEELEDQLAALIGDRQGLNAELLLCLQGLQAGRSLVHVGIHQGANARRVVVRQRAIEGRRIGQDVGRRAEQGRIGRDRVQRRVDVRYLLRRARRRGGDVGEIRRALRQQARRDNPVLYSKLADARHRTHMPKA